MQRSPEAGIYPRLEFDKTELTYYPRPMYTQPKPQPKETPCNPQSSIHNPQCPNSPSAGRDRMRRNAAKTRAREASSPVIPAKAGIPSIGMERLRPGRSGFDVSLGVAIPEPSCQ